MFIEYFLTISHYTKNIIENIRNFICLFVSIMTVYASYSRDITNIKYITYLIYIQCSTDLLVCKSHLILHHIYSIIGMLYIIYLLSKYKDIIEIILLCETSTIFLTIQLYFDYYLSKNNIISIANKISFIITFFYYRIYLFTKYIILTFIIDFVFYENIPFFTFLFLFYFLNIYWFILIFKKAVKMML